MKQEEFNAEEEFKFDFKINQTEFNEIPPTKPVPTSIKVNNKSGSRELDKTVKDETQQLDRVAENAEQIDTFFDRKMKQEWTIGDRLVNRSMYKQVQEVKGELVKQSAKYRLAFYRSILDTRLTYLNEKCSAGIKIVKGAYRQEVSMFLMEKVEELSKEITVKQYSFLEMMKEKYQYAETLVNLPSMHQNYMKTIFSEEERYLKFLEALMVKFESIVDEEIRKY